MLHKLLLWRAAEMNDTEPTYNNRTLSDWTIASFGAGTTTDTEGWTTGAPSELLARAHTGDTVQRETIGGPWGTYTGWLVGGEWIDRKSDQDVERERQTFLDDIGRRHREALDRNRDDWRRRTAELPGWVRDRIATFRERGGERFELEGWGYELIIAELAVMYAADAFEDTPRILAYAEEQGSSGNQHDCAKALARAHTAGQSLAGTVSGLSPLTVDPFYSGVLPGDPS